MSRVIRRERNALESMPTLDMSVALEESIGCPGRPFVPALDTSIDVSARYRDNNSSPIGERQIFPVHTNITRIPTDPPIQFDWHNSPDSPALHSVDCELVIAYPHPAPAAARQDNTDAPYPLPATAPYHRNLNTNGKQTDNGQSRCYISNMRTYSLSSRG